MKILITIVLFLLSERLFAQNKLEKSDDLGRVSLTSFIPDQIEGLTSSVQSNLLSKLKQIVTKNGLGSGDLNNRFILTANVVVLSKDIISSAPLMHAYTLEVTLYIGDGIEGTLFSSTSVILKGVGETETKAYNAALKNLITTDAKYQNFLDQGKRKIIEYFNSKCDFILKDAITKANSKDYDEALFILLGVPQVCKNCFDKAQDSLIYVYKLKMENNCQENISKSRVAISQNNYDEASNWLVGVLPDLTCYQEAQELLTKIENHRCAVALGKAHGAWASHNADEAGHWLSEVTADSKCNDEAIELGIQIKKYLKEKEDKEWQFELRKHKDEVANNMASIDAATKIGVAFAKNQPRRVTYIYRGWW